MCDERATHTAAPPFRCNNELLGDYQGKKSQIETQLLCASQCTFWTERMTCTEKFMNKYNNWA